MSIPFTGFMQSGFQSPLKGLNKRGCGFLLIPGVNAWAREKRIRGKENPWKREFVEKRIRGKENSWKREFVEKRIRGKENLWKMESAFTVWEYYLYHKAH
jgi:hypothetical protein